MDDQELMPNRPGPLHDAARCIDTIYENGSRDTLTCLGRGGLLVLCYSATELDGLRHSGRTLIHHWGPHLWSRVAGGE